MKKQDIEYETTLNSVLRMIDRLSTNGLQFVRGELIAEFRFFESDEWCIKQGFFKSVPKAVTPAVRNGNIIQFPIQQEK